MEGQLQFGMREMMQLPIPHSIGIAHIVAETTGHEFDGACKNHWVKCLRFKA